MTYLFDTDTLILYMRGLSQSSSNRTKSQRLRDAALRMVEIGRHHADVGDKLVLSAITRAELEFGARNALDYEQEHTRIQRILMPFEIRDFDGTACARQYGTLRKFLQERGTIIGAMDMLIAAHALALSATLVTNNLREFTRIPGLKVESWMEV